MDTHEQRDGWSRGTYHDGDLREALITAALEMISERGLAGLAVAELARAVGVSQGAPYRHFRDRNAIVAEVARRGFEQLAADLETARRITLLDPVAALGHCAQAHLTFAGRESAVYAAMFAPGFPIKQYPDLLRARGAAFAAIREVAQAACDQSLAQQKPPGLMMALHVWSMTRGIADLYVSHGEDGGGQLPMSPSELLESGLLVYLQALNVFPKH
ncbi:MAG: TetR/AcrR family transcriptional regulator [Janthinobacterium lividum]